MHIYDIYTAQQGPHHDLIGLVNRFKNTKYRRPIPQIQQRAFQSITDFYNKRRRPLIIDAGCGTGMSTKHLACMYPDHDVIGIDKSKHRLYRNQEHQNNVLLVHGNLIDLWPQIAREHLPVTHQYLFYPNPWPKIGQVKRRFHAHPIFKTMLSIARYFEVRTNWQIYAEELMIALKLLGQEPSIYTKNDKNFISLFEKKYLKAFSKIFVVTNQYS